jgi:hypothetical protein
MNQFTVTFHKVQSEIVTFRYYETFEKGGTASIGAQNHENGRAIEFLFKQDRVLLQAEFSSSRDLVKC